MVLKNLDPAYGGRRGSVGDPNNSMIIIFTKIESSICEPHLTIMLKTAYNLFTA